MEVFEWAKNWIYKKFNENLEDIRTNYKLIWDNLVNVFLSLILMAIGFYILKDYSSWLIFRYSIIAIWILFFNTLVIVKNRNYFFTVLVILLVGEALTPVLVDGAQFAIVGNWLNAVIYVGVWIAIKLRFNKLKNE